jgi:hypothetical protein
MNDIITKLSKQLDFEDVGLKCRTIGKTEEGKYKGLFFAHKTSRSVYNRFNEVCGLGWEDEYFYDAKDNLCCKLIVWDPEKERWIKRVGVGVPSGIKDKENAIEKEKATYSDALKRASVEFGHGLELYYMPKIIIDLEEREVELEKGKYSLHKYKVDLKRWKISYKWENKKVSDLIIKNEKGELKCKI